MSQFQKHLYAIMYPNQALVASQLEPHDFGKHYAVGSSRYYSGKIIFVEVDVNFRNPYFEIDRALEKTVEHPDGTPKHTKFICTYRTLEHLDFQAFRSLYAVNVEGHALQIDKAPYTAVNDPGLIRIFQELNPQRFLVASTYDQRDFGRILTQSGYSKGCPKIMFCQIDLTIDQYLKDIETNPFLPPPIPGVHPLKLSNTILALRKQVSKAFKTISLDSAFGQISYNRLRHGFWFTHQDEMLFYPLPSMQELQRNHFHWFRGLGT